MTIKRPMDLIPAGIALFNVGLYAGSDDFQTAGAWIFGALACVMSATDRPTKEDTTDV